MNRGVVVVGVAAFALGVAAMADPGVVPLRVDRALLPVAGLVPLVLAYRVVQARRRSRIRRARTPDPEVPVAVDAPGDDLGTAVADLTGSRRRCFTRRGLRTAAVAVLQRYDGVSASEARERLDRGTWTDDPYAAAFFGDGERLSLASRLRGRLGSGSTYEACRRRAVEAMAARAGLSTGYREDGGGFRRWIGDGDATTVELADGGGGERTGHWRGVAAVPLLAIGAGVLFEAAPLVLAGTVGVGFAAYARSTSVPRADLAFERRLDEEEPQPGEAVTVTATVTNEGDAFLPDVRVVDGVPAALSVVDGSPRLGTALRPGESATVTYAVEARRGVHAFDPATVLVRDLAGTGEAARRLDDPATLTCVPRLRGVGSPVPIRASATTYAGRVETSSGGEGVEFFATREYRPGDPPSRIDWNRRARGDEFATLEFREERAATVVVIVDARSTAYVAPEPYAPHGLDRAVEAATRVVAARLDAGDRVGFATVGADCWIDPGTGRDHRARLEEQLATHPALSSVPGPRSRAVQRGRRLGRRLPVEAQLVILTPLADAYVARLVRRLDAGGNPASVISPDPTVRDAPERLFAALARRVRISELRAAGVPVADWSPDESLDAVLARAAGRWST